MPYVDIPAFIGALRARAAMAALALEFTTLTAARSGEVLGATWAEVDLQKAVWTVPASRMKAGEEHRFPMSPRAVAILEAVKPLGSETLFSGIGGGKLSGMAVAMLLRRMNADVTVHEFGAASATGPLNAQAMRTRSAKWRWLTRSGAQSKPPIDAATCSKSVGGS